MSIVKKCSCDHSYQDKKYGEKRRVFNPTLKQSMSGKTYRCTVCGSEVGHQEETRG